MKTQSIIISLCLTLLISCSKDEITISDNAKDFLNEVLNIMEANSINRNEIEWIDFRNKVFESAGVAQSIEETYGAIRLALTLLEDNHSYFKKPDGTYIFGSRSINCQAESVSSASVPEGIGYVKVNSFTGSDNEKAIAFAKEIQDQIRIVDSATILGWIVDLRGNTGGNMWPMLAGIGPILGEGIAGYFITPDNSQTPWGYSNGASIINQYPLVQLTDAYELINLNPKVAVLLDNAVSSSGEAIAVSFIGRNNTKSFGSPTCGLSTANSGFNLSNNSTLILTVSYMADRNKNLYGTPIIPDMEVDNQNIIQNAVEFISN